MKIDSNYMKDLLRKMYFKILKKITKVDVSCIDNKFKPQNII